MLTNKNVIWQNFTAKSDRKTEIEISKTSMYHNTFITAHVKIIGSEPKAVYYTAPQVVGFSFSQN